jgi:hypothetical protein
MKNILNINDESQEIYQVYFGWYGDWGLNITTKEYAAELFPYNFEGILKPEDLANKQFIPKEVVYSHFYIFNNWNEVRNLTISFGNYNQLNNTIFIKVIGEVEEEEGADIWFPFDFEVVTEVVIGKVL